MTDYLLPLQGEGWDGDGFRVKSKPPPSLALGQSSALLFPSSSPDGEDFKAKTLKICFQLLIRT